jgi:hypothetical protein
MGLLFAAGKLDEATKEMKQLHEIMKTLHDACTDVEKQIKAMPIPYKLGETILSYQKGLYNLVKNVGLTPHPRCFIVLPSSLDGNSQALSTLSPSCLLFICTSTPSTLSVFLFYSFQSIFSAQVFFVSWYLLCSSLLFSCSFFCY